MTSPTHIRGQRSPNDKDLGLPSSETQFDRSGKVVGRVRYEYDQDTYGNWTERRKFVTQAADPNGSWKLAGTTRRIIAYY